MMKVNEKEKQRIRDRLAEIRKELLRDGILCNPKADALIRESNILGLRLKWMGG